MSALVNWAIKEVVNLVLFHLLSCLDRASSSSSRKFSLSSVSLFLGLVSYVGLLAQLFCKLLRSKNQCCERKTNPIPTTKEVVSSK